MSHKTTVTEMYEAGKDYDEIEEATGAKRSYIRTIISQYKKLSDKKDSADEDDEIDETNDEVINNEMHFEDDLEGKNNMVGGEMGDPKTGKEYHKAWVAEKAFECACGCTLNRRSTYCPNCGTVLNWEGF